MATFSRSVVIEAPVGTVFAFHERDDALALLTPRFPPMRVVHRSGGITRGASVELRVGGIRWIALHTAYEKNHLFVDEQIAGPFARWIHRHEFEDLGGQTRLTDHLEYRPRGGALTNALLAWMVKPGLIRMFRHRHKITKRYCESA